MEQLKRITKFVIAYLVIYLSLAQGIPHGIAYGSEHLPRLLGIVLLFPLKSLVVMAIIFGLVASFYLWWKKKPTALLPKIVVWLWRVGIVILSALTIIQVEFLIFDWENTGKVALEVIRYNVVHDLGLKSAAGFMAFRFLER